VMLMLLSRKNARVGIVLGEMRKHAEEKLARS